MARGTFAAMTLSVVASGLACQLVYPNDLSTVCESPGAFCDDFARSSPLPATPSKWGSIDCDPVASLTANGALHLHYPAHQRDAWHHCYLLSSDLSPTGKVALDFDLTLHANAPFDTVVAAFTLTPSAPRPDMLKSLTYQLLVQGDGVASTVAVPEYPGPTFPAVELYRSPSRWLEDGVPCHVRLDLDVRASTMTGTSTCNGRTYGMAPDQVTNVSVVGPMKLLIGYSTYKSDAYPDWDLTFDDLALTVE